MGRSRLAAPQSRAKARGREICGAGEAVDRDGNTGDGNVCRRQGELRSVPNLVPVRRHARNRFAYVACGGLVLATSLSTAFSLERSHKDQTEAENRLKTGSHKLDSPLIPNVRPLISRLAYTYSCQQPADYNQAALCVALSTAEYTKHQAFWAMRTFWLGMFGTLAVFAALF